MSTKAEREDRFSAPMSIDWCKLTDPPCSFGSYGRCGIKERLREFPTKMQEEAERLHAIAKEDPERFREICEKGLFG